jgi:hypothetical protein
MSGGLKIKVAVEAKDEGRPWDLTHVDRYLGKYRGEGRVLVDKIVLVSRHGFTAGAIEKAKLADVVLFTLDEAKNFDWTNLDPKYGDLKQSAMLHVRIAPHVCKVVLEPPIEGDDGKAAKEGKLVCEHSEDHGTPFEFARRAIFEKRHPPTIDKLKELERLATGQPNGAVLQVEFDMSHYRLRYRGGEHPLRRITVIVHVTDATTRAECKAYELDTPEGKQIIHHMSASLDEKHFQWVMPQGLKSKKMAMRIGHPPQTPKTPKQRAEERKKKRKKKS